MEDFISSLLVKRGGSLSFLVRTISNVLVMEIGWTDVGSGEKNYMLSHQTFQKCSFRRSLFDGENLILFQLYHHIG
jgi:hypothetical protein